MKYLQIDNNKGFFKLTNDENYKSIDTISKEDIFKLISVVIESDEDIEMDDFSDELIQNKAHNIIYRNLHQKLTDLKLEKNNIIDSTNQYFEEAFQKYSN